MRSTTPELLSLPLNRKLLMADPLNATPKHPEAIRHLRPSPEGLGPSFEVDLSEQQSGSSTQDWDVFTVVADSRPVSGFHFSGGDSAT